MSTSRENYCWRNGKAPMHSYIVLVSPSYGGAEKRFFDIFTSMRRGGVEIGLIAPSSLTQLLMADHPERADVFDAMLTVPLAAWSRAAFIKAFRRMLRGLPRRSNFHYPLNCLWPLHVGRGDRVSLSLVDCTRVCAPLGGTVTAAWSWLACFFAARVDVLSPAIFDAMRDFRMAPKMSLTPGGTYMVPPAPTSVAKAPTIVFISRLVAGKGVTDLLDALPALWQRVRERAPAGFAFEIAGYGALEPEVAARVATLAAAGVPVRFLGYAVAAQLLPSSAIVLSLQETTNFPSRVVPESLLAGSAVIVRDSGDSRQFGQLPGLLYCKAVLDPDELADQITTLLARVLHEPGFQELVRDAGLARFCAPSYLDYFADLIGAVRRAGTRDA